MLFDPNWPLGNVSQGNGDKHKNVRTWKYFRTLFTVAKNYSTVRKCLNKLCYITGNSFFKEHLMRWESICDNVK